MDSQKAKKALETAMVITKKHWKTFAGGFPAPASENDCYAKISNEDWTAGFYTGMLWIFYECTRQEFYLWLANEHVISFRERLDRRVMVDHHDMGFLYSLSCVAAYKLTQNGLARKTALLAADNLKSRFQEKGAFIQAWGPLGDPTNYRLIVDCLLNLPLLYWASEVTGDKTYRLCALKHLETTRRVIVRDDFSTYHTYYFDQESGKPVRGATKQGYSDSSAWSRGQAWAVYGLMLNYAYHKDASLLPQWKGITDYFMAHLPEDLAAYWDLHFNEGPEPRDSSASAIAVCGILEAYRQGVCGAEYRDKAYAILDSLVDHYATKADENANGILKHSTYGRLLGEGIDECTLWGDYFYTEALMRVVHPDWKMYW